MTRRAATLSTAGMLALALGLGASQLTVPYVGLGPGPVTDTLGTIGGKPLIEVTGRQTYPARGHLDLTTVNVYTDLDLGTALRYWFDRSFAVVPREVVYPPDLTPEESEEQNRQEMKESQEHAVTAALRELDIPVTFRLVVGEVTQAGGAEAAGIHSNDVIVAVQGARPASFEALREQLAAIEPGTTVRVTYRRGRETRTVPVRTAADPGDPEHALLGVVIEERATYPFTVKILLEDVGGPSAGLMFALGVVDVLTPGDLTGGHHVAGTGSITDDGDVGGIGGIQQKLIAARRAGATHFLTPAENWDAANAARPDGLTLVKVGTLTEALAAVRRIAG